MDISIVIINYNSGEYLSKCLSGLKGRRDNLEVIVVDNGSNDGSFDKAGKSFTDNIYIKLDKNLGFSKANNIGAKKAKGEVLVFLNPDTEASVEGLMRLANFVSKNQEVGVASPKMLYPDGRVQRTIRLAYPNLRSIFLASPFGLRFFKNSTYLNKVVGVDLPYDKLMFVEHLMGACFAIKRDLFNKISGWDERYFLYWEDADLCYRVKKLKKKVAFFPEVELIHYEAKSTSGIGGMKSVYYYKGLLRFIGKNYGAIYGFFVQFYLFISTLILCIGMQIKSFGLKKDEEYRMTVNAYLRLLWVFLV